MFIHGLSVVKIIDLPLFDSPKSGARSANFDYCGCTMMLWKSVRYIVNTDRLLHM